MPPIVVGHRGVSGHFPENTKVSIVAAIELGLKWIEVDIQPSKDDVLVVCHDHTVNRCSNGIGRIDDLTFDQLRKLDFGAWYGSRFSGEVIMSLSELLALADTHKIGINIEIKIDRHNAAHVVALLKAQLESSRHDKERLIFSSFDHNVMRQLYQQLNGYKLGVLSRRLRKADQQLLNEIDAFSCHLNFRWTTKRHVEMLHKSGYQVWCYTVNSPKRLAHLSTLDAIFSDYPERFIHSALGRIG
ncbi:glycerophosphodiester phosphodiesterase family protein [Vibrio hippocampi]|uniref:Glycerophosphodiester phosphodiesterase, cytoplasmic n=1 Tax=Vibrio hippocampi TaxID=654686 RepID=A0ABM8ZLL5_9VIBR|nr:glycerophosphodiester phosphodiesterase family protein [Vibrio hippocampi]CAH0529046.1 Glycerophosphodiester phosphodiesterase, cytoplasmic [Vibrio hippocampi]